MVESLAYVTGQLKLWSCCVRNGKHDRSHLMGWTVSYVLAAGILVWVIWQGPLGDLACSGDDEHCFREWMGALSGWVGLGAALFTVAVMRQQLREQRDQASFMRGDVMPHVYASADSSLDDDRYYPCLDITVTNVNRRPLRIGRLECLSEDPGVQISIASTASGGDRREAIFSRRIKHTYVHQIVPGRDPAAAATACTVRCHVWYNGELVPLPRNPDMWKLSRVRVKLHCELLDRRNEPVLLEAEADINVAIPFSFEVAEAATA